MSDVLAVWQEGKLEVRAVRGHKTTKREGKLDNAFEVRTPGGEWIRWTMRAQVLMAGLIMQNEDNLYPPEQGFAGGGWLLRAFTTARDSVEAAWEQLQWRPM